MTKSTAQRFSDVTRQLIAAKEAEYCAKQAHREACFKFGAAFRSLREEKGLTLRFVASALGVSPAYLSDVELGRRFPNLDIKTYFDS